MTPLDYIGLWSVAGMLSFLFGLYLDRKEHGAAFYSIQGIDILFVFILAMLFWPLYSVDCLFKCIDTTSMNEFLTKERKLWTIT